MEFYVLENTQCSYRYCSTWQVLKFHFSEESAVDWWLLTTISTNLITCIISFCHVQNCGIHQGIHLSPQLPLAGFTHTAMLHTSQTQRLTFHKNLFSPRAVCFSSFCMTLSDALLYKLDSYVRALNILHTWIRVHFSHKQRARHFTQCWHFLFWFKLVMVLDLQRSHTCFSSLALLLSVISFKKGQFKMK